MIFYPVLPMGKTYPFTHFHPVLPNRFYPVGKTYHANPAADSSEITTGGSEYTHTVKRLHVQSVGIQQLK